MFDLVEVGQILIKNGPWGIAVAILVWQNHQLSQRLATAQEAHRQDLQQTVVKATEAVALQSEVTRANTAAQDRATSVMSGLNDTVRTMHAVLNGIEKDLDRIEARGTSA